MGDPPSDHPGVHPPPYKPPKWDGRRKAPRDAEEARRKKEAIEKQEAEAQARRDKQGTKAKKRQALQTLKSVEFEDRRFVRELAAWEREGAEGPAPIPEEDIPGWAAVLHASFDSWVLVAEVARTRPFEDPTNNLKLTGPAWKKDE